MSPQTLLPPERTETPHAAAPESDERREWLMVGVGLCGLVALMAIVIAVFAIADGARAAGGAPPRGGGGRRAGRPPPRWSAARPPGPRPPTPPPRRSPSPRASRSRSSP